MNKLLPLLLIFTLIAGFSLIAVPRYAFAGGDDVPLDGNSGGDDVPNDDLPNIETVDDVIRVIDNITNWMFTIFIAVAVIMVLIAAFKYLTSGGGEETAKAHKMILYAAVAIAVAILAKGVVNVVKSIVK